MEEHPNVTMYREIMDAVNAGDFEKSLEATADDIEWWEIGSTEPIRGKANLIAHMQEAMGDYSITADLHDVVANDEHLVALIEATAERGGDTLHYRTAEIYHIRDGKMTHRWAFSDDTEAINRFFA